ncbi:MAG TPA: MFS transporter [Candidatus Limnocylindrales bacterium]|nr:MFS transporter [Candidatus Limnocylindrales bacterium]
MQGRFAAVGGAFAVAGVCTVMLGPLLPRLQAQLHLHDKDAGLLFAAQFLASVAVSSFAGPLAARFGYLRLIAAGMLLCAAGTVALLSTPWPLPVVCAAINGCGLGLAIPAGNLSAASCEPGSDARAILFVNLMWCLGAIAAPPLVTHAPLWVTSVACLLCAIPLVRRSAAHGNQPPRIPFRLSRAMALTAALLFFYVGTETSVAGWVASLASRSTGTRSLWTVLPSVFWAGLLGGRALAPALLDSLRPASLILGGMACAFAGATLLLAQSASGLTTLAVAICGLGMAPIYPLVVSEYTTLEPAGAASGIIFSAGGLGGAAIPWAIGAISDATGNLRGALATVLVLIVLMSVLQRNLATTGPGKQT